MSIERIPVEGISSIDRRLPALTQLSRQLGLSLSPGELRMLAEKGEEETFAYIRREILKNGK